MFINKSKIDLTIPQKYDFGCGEAKEVGFIGVDCRDIHGVDIISDVIGLSEFPIGCASVIHSDHFIEHLEYNDVKTLILAWSKMLISGGSLIIYAPDLLEVSKNANLFWQWAAYFAYGMQRYPEDKHNSFWTYDSLKEMVKLSCFHEIEKIPYPKPDHCFSGMKKKWTLGLKATKI